MPDKLFLENKELYKALNLEDNMQKLIVDGFSIKLPEIAKDFEKYHNEFCSTREELDKVVMGFFGKNHIELFDDGIEIYKKATIAYENNRRVVLDFYTIIVSFKQYFAMDLIDFIKNYIEKVVGYGNLKESQLKVLHEYSKISNYSFHIDIDKFENEIEYIDTLKFQDFAKKVFSNLSENIFTEENIGMLIEYNSKKNNKDPFEIDLLQNDIKKIKNQAIFEIGKEVLKAVDNRMEEVEHYKKEFKKIINSFEDLRNRIVSMSNSLNLYILNFNDLKKLYDIYNFYKRDVLFKLDKLYSNSDFKKYLKVHNKLKKHLENESKKLNYLIENYPVKPNIIMLLLNFFTNAKDEYEKKLSVHNEKVFKIKKNISIIESNLVKINQYLKKMKKHKVYNEAYDAIVHFAGDIRPLKESLNKGFNMNNK